MKASGKIVALSCLALVILGACTPSMGDSVVVAGVGDDDLLKLRGGPGLGYRVVLGLPDGTVLTRRDCVTEVGQLWCRVALGNAPSVTGYVSADYLARK